jgi:hypothetical protein
MSPFISEILNGLLFLALCTAGTLFSALVACVGIGITLVIIKVSMIIKTYIHKLIRLLM